MSHSSIGLITILGYSNNITTLSSSFARAVAGNEVFNGVVEDLNLNASYWTMYGFRSADPTPGALDVHTGIPTLSSIRVNPTIDNVTVRARSGAG